MGRHFVSRYLNITTWRLGPLALLRSFAAVVLALALLLAAHIPSTQAQATLPGGQALNCQAEYPGARRVTLSCGLGGRWDGAIYIYNRSQQVNPSRPWQENISQTDALWIFDARPAARRALDGRASLIIDFQSSDRGVRADLYDDQNATGAVEYGLPEGDADPQIKENALGLPSIRVQAQDGWTLPGDKVNYNLDIAIDGAIRGDFSSDIDRYYNQFHTDGVIDFKIEVRDNNRDGVADYDYRDSSVKGNRIHTALMVSNEKTPTPLSDTLIWPFLATREWGFDQAYNQLKAPIQVNWAASKIVAVGEYVPSRGRSSNWFVYSFVPVTKGQSNLTNFESPFAFYNLSGIEDGFPDLQVRFERFNPGELVRNFPQPIESVRYSWDMYHRQAWDYKVDLLGRHPVTGTLQFNDFSIQGLPYGDIPRWVSGKTWDQVNFVAYEGPGFFYSTEGIYDWGAQGEIRDNYITGQQTTFSKRPFEQISEGMRGEYRVAPNSTPRLYISSVDHKLHLFGAQGGLWNIDQRSSVTYADTSGDGFIDQWTYTRVIPGSQPITTTQQLNVARDYLVLSNGREVRLRNATVSPVLAWAAPPTDHASWQELGATLKRYQGSFSPSELDATVAEFEGPELRIQGASLRNYRALGDRGFRFVLTLSPGFQVDGAPLRGGPLLALKGLQPGDYLISFDGTSAGSLAVVPLTPPVVSGQLLALSPSRMLESTALQVQLHNDGREDLQDATLEIWAIQPEGPSRLVVTQTVTLLAQQTITPTLRWLPRVAGPWMLTPLVRDSDDQVALLGAVPVTVLPAQKPDPISLILLGTYPAMLPLVIAGLLLFAAIAVLVFRWRWKVPQVRQTHDKT